MGERKLPLPFRFGADPRRNIAFGDYEGNITFLDPATGTPVARTKLSGAVTTPAAQYGYGAVFQTVEGDVAYVVEGADSE